MTGHLLLVSLGPVQEFIAQARRTRDLWFGSHILSEISRAAARALAEEGAALVFPALERGDLELDPEDRPVRRDGKAPLAIANKILAVVPAAAVGTTLDPEKLAKVAREAGRARFRQIADRVKGKCAQLLAPAIDAVWDEQIDTMMEFAAAWTALGDGPDGYRLARDEIEAALGGRKNLRDFPSWRHQRGGVPKSSLDGARETVLAQPAPRTGEGYPGRTYRSAELARKYRIADGEQLDAVGLVKRAGGEPDQFVPVANVAMAPWIQAAAEAGPDRLDSLRRACQEIGIGRVSRSDLPWLSPLPFDAQVLLRDRWKSLLEELGSAQDGRDWGRNHVGPVLESMAAPPYPYVACLVADGDRMGKTLDFLPSSGDHQKFSTELGQFAVDARDIVERCHRGLLVYSGGDDVLAFLCLNDVLACAEALRKCFAKHMENALNATAQVDRPTLSVGIGIGHVLESMADLLSLGRQAESAAKGAALAGEALDRNALAVLIDKRSGGRMGWRARWENNPCDRLSRDIEVLSGPLSHKKVYEVRADLARMPSWRVVSSKDDAEWSMLLHDDVARTLARTDAGASVPLTPDHVGLDLDSKQTYKKSREVVDQWVCRMMVARVLSEAKPRQRRRAGGGS